MIDCAGGSCQVLCMQVTGVFCYLAAATARFPADFTMPVIVHMPLGAKTDHAAREQPEQPPVYSGF